MKADAVATDTALRSFVARVVGWTNEAAIDRAVLAITQRFPLVLVGEGSLRSVARMLHLLAGGGELTCIRHSSRGLERELFTAVRQRGQTLANFDVLAATQTSRVIMWARTCRCPLCSTIELPSMAERARRGELHRVVDEYGADAIAAFKAPGTFTPRDRAWVLAHSAATLDDVEKGTLRRIALRATGTINGAATLLGMSHVSLAAWFKRRRVLEA